MKTPKALFLVVLALAAISAISFKQADRQPVHPPDPKQMIADWERAKAYTLEYLNASTDEVISFKPTPEMRSFGQQMLHLADANYGMASAASGIPSKTTFGTLEKTADQYATKAALTKAVSESYDFVIAAAKEMNEQKLGETVNVFKMDMPRGLVFSKVFEHQTHHRGQTTVYLRMKGITPPQEKLF